jgi:hypothetical protein
MEIERKRRKSLIGEEIEARYANFFHIGHNAFEVILEFGQHYEGNRQPGMHTRIVAAPAYAKALLALLNRSLADYEREFGSIGSRETQESSGGEDLTWRQQ